MSLGERLVDRLAGLAVAVYALAPVFWLVSLSVTPSNALGAGRLWPREPTLAHYRGILDDPLFLSALGNSALVALGATALAVALATGAAYAAARLPLPGRSALLGGALVVAVFPPIAVVGPLFEIWRTVGLYDTRLGLVLPYTVLALPLALWTLTAFFRQIPPDLERAARMDGAGTLQVLTRVVAPLAAPGLATTAILTFLFAWNELLFAVSLTATDRARTVPAALAFFTGRAQFERPTGSLAAAAVLVTVPVVVLVLAFERRIVSGLTAGAVRG